MFDPMTPALLRKGSDEDGLVCGVALVHLSQLSELRTKRAVCAGLAR